MAAIPCLISALNSIKGMEDDVMWVVIGEVVPKGRFQEDSFKLISE